MGVALFTNNAVGTLAGSITNAVTAITVASGQGALFPSPSGGDWFYATLYNASQYEIVKCTGRSTDTLTVTRGQEGTSALAFSAGDKVELRITATDLNAFLQPGRNLSELTNAATARTNLGLGSAATHATGDFALTANNLSDLTNATTARTNLGLGTAAVAATGASGHALPFLDGANTWAAAQTFSGALTGALTGNVTGNCSGSSGSCTGNAASASTAPRLDLASGVAIDWDGTNIRFIIGGVVKAYVNPTTGLTNNV